MPYALNFIVAEPGKNELWKIPAKEKECLYVDK
jgi:hypothetical protein